MVLKALWNRVQTSKLLANMVALHPKTQPLEIPYLNFIVFQWHFVSQVPDKQVGLNKQAGSAEFFIHCMKNKRETLFFFAYVFAKAESIFGNCFEGSQMFSLPRGGLMKTFSMYTAFI